MLKKIGILVVISTLTLARVFSQTPSYYHYTSSDGLASSTVYSIIQDQNGFIWFATQNGLSKFDGKHFKTFRTEDGLNSNSITALVEGNNGELFIGTYENGISVFKNGKIENYCPDIDGKTFATSYLFNAPSGEDGQRLITYRAWGSINVIHEKKPDSKPDYSFNTYPERLVKLEKLWDEKVIAVTVSGLYEYENKIFTKLFISGLPNNNNFCLTPGNDRSYYIGARGMIYRIKNDTVITRYIIDLYSKNNDVTAIYIDKNNNIWFSIMNRGFYLIPDGTDKIIDIGSKMDLQNTLVNHYLEDNEGDIWISTYGNGVYCLNNLYLKKYTENDGLSSNSVYAIEQDNAGRLIIGTFNGLNVFENGQFNRITSNSANTMTEYIYEIKNINNDIYVCGTFGVSEMINSTYNELKLYLLSAPSFCKTTQGLYLVGTNGNQISVHKYLHDPVYKPVIFSVFGDSSIINRVNEIFEDSERNLWIGTNLGLCKISGLTYETGLTGIKKTFFPSDRILSSRINSIIHDDQFNIWLAGDMGIASYNIKNDSVTSYSKILDYNLTSSTSLAFDTQKRLWVGNMKGLFLLDFSGEIKVVKFLNGLTGLPTDELLSLSHNIGKNLLYIGTSNGISVLDINLFDKISPPALDVKILGIKAGDSVYTSFDNLVFKPKQNHVNIEFKALCFSSPGSVKYRYLLNGELSETDHDFLDLVSLKNGVFDLQIMAKSQNADWGKPSTLRFEVKPFFKDTIGFKLGFLLLIVIVYLAFVTWRVKLSDKKKRDEFELTRRINELKHQALSAMMNPHFIFNSLNSVQYLINSQRNEEANDYIAILAKLVRKNLDTAGKGMILLSEEINRLTLYLDLEKLRLQESFSYEIIIGDSVDAGSTMIPNMIIQPFVENTLWHGIIDSGNHGLLTVSFAFEDIDIDSVLCKSLIIKITDNGIGINEARKNKKEDHISKGIQIIEERLILLSARLQIPKPILVEDLSSRNGNSQGTEVIISLPPQLYQIITPES